MSRTILLVLASFVCFASPVLAHRVFLAFAERENRIEVEAFYEGNAPAHSAKVKVVDDMGETVVEGMTDAKGVWSFPLPRPGAYVVHLDAGAGHRLKKKLTVPLPERKRDLPPNQSIESASTESPNIESRDEQARTPWARIGLGLAFIGGASGTLLLVSRMRQSLKNRQDQSEA